jgi:hypothetical protein
VQVAELKNGPFGYRNRVKAIDGGNGRLPGTNVWRHHNQIRLARKRLGNVRRFAVPLLRQFGLCRMGGGQIGVGDAFAMPDKPHFFAHCQFLREQ